MNRLAKAFSICIFSFLLPLEAFSQEATNDELIEDSTIGYVNFNLGKHPGASPERQEVSLYGCNTEVSTRIPVFNGEKNLAWNTKDQVLPNVPYGYHYKDERRYYVSKYYMASPPVFLDNKKDATKPVNIGLVLPDHFTFFGDKPVQIAHLDYEILQPVYLNYVDINYDFRLDNTIQSCQDLKVNTIPINIQCADFKWINKYSTPAIVDAQGASGIGQLKNDSLRNRVFLPSYKLDAEYLDCKVTILDDIMLEHEVFFVKEDGELVKTINLTDFYKRNFKLNTELNIVCGVRTELPAGCKKKGE